jgi:hypothetical protein
MQQVVMQQVVMQQVVMQPNKTGSNTSIKLAN